MSILTRVQTNPEIGTDNASFVSELIERAKEFITDYCRLPRFPELSQGYSKSAVTPSTDITGAATNQFWISINGSSYYEANPTLANCDTGANIATELQTTIQAIDAEGFEEVTVAYDSTSGAEYLTITSGRYGEDSAVNLSFLKDYEDVCRELKLTPIYGGTELCGSAYSDRAEDAAVMVVEAMYARMGLEGFTGGSVPWGFSFSAADLSPELRSILNSLRRLW